MLKQLTLLAMATTLIIPILFAQTDIEGNGMSSSWLDKVQSELVKKEYHVKYVSEVNKYQSPNRSNNIRAYYSPGKLELQNRKDSLEQNWSVSVSTLGVFCDGKKEDLPDENAISTVKSESIEFVHPNFVEQYSNSKEGVRQNFIVTNNPTNAETIEIKLAVSGLQLSQVNSSEVHLYQTDNGRKKVRLTYSDLKSWDADNNPLEGQIIVHENAIMLSVNVTNASFPITIDPIYRHYSPVLSSGEIGCKFGWSVDDAGDVNGDGYDDVIVGAYQYDNGTTDEGAAFIYHGSSTGLSTVYSTLLESNTASVRFGHSVSAAGDVNNDGYDDVLVGCYYYTNGQTNEGAVHVYHGSSSGVSTTASFTAEGNQASGFFGVSVAGVGDIDGDTYDDILVGASNYDNGSTDEGRAYVFYGSASGITSSGSDILEENQAYMYFGGNVDGAGDVNGDGYDDVIVGARLASYGQTNEGCAFVYLGTSTGINTTYANRLEINQSGARLGERVGRAGDVNGDGYDDVWAGARDYDYNFSNDGSIFIYHGSSTGISTSATQIGGLASSDQLAKAAHLGDVNNDGYDDLGVMSSASVRVHYGSSTGLDVNYQDSVANSSATTSFGISVSGGDFNGDGYGDMIVGDHLYDNGTTTEGGAFVIYGSHSGLALDSSDFVDGGQAGANFGASVSSAGDVNGDGYSDVIIGAYTYDNGSSNEGAAFIFHGSSTGLENSFDTILEVNQANCYFGYSVSNAGDVNGDGYGDVIVGAYDFTNGQSDEGAAFVFHGSATGVSPTVVTQVESNYVGAEFGRYVSTAGDVNADGYSDVIVGAHLFENGATDEGAAFIYHGSSSGISTTVSSQLEMNNPGANFGISVACAGDVNGDGYSDVIVGGNDYENGQTDEGGAFVFHGSASGVSTTVSSTLELNQAYSEMGYGVSSAGDVNGDGYSDILVGARYYDNGHSSEGCAAIYHGSASGISTTADIVVEIHQAGAYLGKSVSAAGDVNGDGYSDIVVGAANFDGPESNEGTVLVYLGSSTGIDTLTKRSIESNQASSYFGTSVSSAGDVNGDGYADILIGARLYDNGLNAEGAAFVFMGSPAIFNRFSDYEVIDTNQSYAYFGYDVSSAGDVNGDGFDDVIIGSPRYDNGETDEGAAYVYLGSVNGLNTTAANRWEPDSASLWYGWAVSGAGDLNGDGYADVVVTASQAFNSNYDGFAYVYYGSSSGLGSTHDIRLDHVQSLQYFGSSACGVGDLNGDGYDDLAIGGPLYDGTYTNEGSVTIYYGTDTGVSLTNKDLVVGGAANANIGSSVSGAGDVNGDGYDDLIVGAENHTNGQSQEGAVYIYMGSSTGVSLTYANKWESDEAYAGLGKSVSGGGDLNGDGFGDIVYGGWRVDNGTSDEGVAYVHYGSLSGINSTPDLILENNCWEGYFGYCVSANGDYNGDGYADVLVCAPDCPAGQSDEGLTHIYYGSSKGLINNGLLIYETNSANQRPYSADFVGDVNGDGFGDFMVGSHIQDGDQTQEGLCALFYGNKKESIQNNLRAYDNDTVSLFTFSSIPDVTMGIGLFAKSPLGRMNGKLVWETVHEGEPFSSSSPITNSTQFTSQSTNFSDLGLLGVELKDVINKESAMYKRTYIRARLKYDPTTSFTGQVYSPWRYIFKPNGGISGFLPVEYLYFSAEKYNSETDAILKWATAQEINNEGFTIQRSVNNQDWDDLGFVKGTNENLGQSYEFIDKNPFTGDNYYRLKQMDFDGTFEFSKVCVLYFEAKRNTVQVFPNPSRGSIAISSNKKVVKIQVFDTKGVMLIDRSNHEGINAVEADGLRSGVYYISITTEDQRMVVKQWFLNH